ncbi:MAG: hypothetical protein IKR85_08090 [Clostridia bacterium]|nr:hypothetical protein [Clostridia bacterium]
MKIRVTGRFYLLLLIVVMVVVLINLNTCGGGSEVTVVMSGVASDTHTVQCIIVRDETLVTDTQVTYTEFAARENTIVREGEAVAYIYKNGNMKKLMNELNTTRQSIQEYHKLILGNELDSELDVLDLEVDARASELKSLIRGASRGNIPDAVRALKDAMDARRAYMSSNRRSDTKLMGLYDRENQRIIAITGQRSVKNAPAEGVVSFYLDGYESTLNADTVKELSIYDAQRVLAGEKLESGEGARSVARLFRIVNQNHWYAVLMSEDGEWNPTLGTVYQFTVAGFDEIMYDGEIINVAKNGKTVMAVLEVSKPIGSLLYTRTGTASIGANMSGLLVSKKALVTVSGQTGVWRYDVPGETFVPVEVLAYRSDGTVLIQPLGELSSGSQVLIK